MKLVQTPLQAKQNRGHAFGESQKSRHLDLVSRVCCWKYSCERMPRLIKRRKTEFGLCWGQFIKKEKYLAKDAVTSGNKHIKTRIGRGNKTYAFTISTQLFDELRNLNHCSNFSTQSIGCVFNEYGKKQKENNYEGGPCASRL